MGTDDQVDRCHLSRGILTGEFGRFHQVTALVHSSTVPLHHMSGTMTTTMQQGEDIPAASEPRGHWLQAPQAVQLIHPELHHFQYLPYQMSPL